MDQLFTIEKIRIGSDTVRLTVNDADTETIFVIFTSDFMSLKLFEGKQVDSDTYNELKSLHYYCYAYTRCLKKLANKDLSRHELESFLDQQMNLSDIQKKAIMDQFVSLGYIDDERLVITQFENDQVKLIGRNKTRYSLMKRGLDEKLISEEYEKVSYGDELARAVRKADIIARSLLAYPEKEKKARLYNKLYDSGYSREIINEAIGSLDLYDAEKEQENIQRAYSTGLRKYSVRFTGRKLYQKLYTFLAQKGYRNEDIREVLEKLQEEENED